MVVTETTTGMLYLWYKNDHALSVPNMISLHSFFSTLPAVFSQACFPEWEVLPQKVCWNCASFCISLLKLTFSWTSTKDQAVARQIAKWSHLQAILLITPAPQNPSIP